jgi:hypothetical protein
MLGALALACAAAAITTRGLSSGIGQAVEAPGSVIVLDAVAGTAALAALGARFLSQEPALVPDAGVLAPLASFLLLVFLGALHGANGSWRTASSWSLLVALGLAVRDLARRKDVARELAGVVVGIASAAAVLGVYDYYVEYPKIRELVEHSKGKLPPEWLYRVSDPMASGPFILPAHFACALAMALPLLLVTLASTTKRRRWPEYASAGLALVFSVLGIVLARSKGASLALLLGVLAFVALVGLTPALRRRLLALGGAVLALALVAGTVQHLRRQSNANVGNSAQVRLEYWSAAARMGAEKPALGQGLERYAELLGSHKSARAEEAKHAHFDALELFAELGLLGPLLFGWSVFALGRAGLRALAPREMPKPPYDPPFAPGATVLFGIAFGALILSGHGDVYDASPERVWLLLLAGGVAAGVSRVVSRALDDPAWARAGAAAALGGALVFVVDGFTDFPLRVHGLFCLALVLAFLAPALAEGPSAPRSAPVPVRAAIGVALSALLLFGLYRVHEDISADVIRTNTREAVTQALGLVRSGKTLTPEEVEKCTQLLEVGAKEYRRLLEANAIGVPDMLLLTDAEEAHGRLTHDPHWYEGSLLELKAALERYPDSRELWSYRGRLEGDANMLPEATRCFDEAARCYPTSPATRLGAATIRVMRIVKGEKDESLRADAVHELHAALACAYASRLDRLHLTDAQVAAAHGLLVSLGEAPIEPGRGEPEPPIGRAPGDPAR